MYLRSLKPDTETYLNLLAIKLHGRRKGNLKNTIEDIVSFLDKGRGINDLELYLKVRSTIPSEIVNPHNFDWLYK